MTLGPVAEGQRINLTFIYFDIEDDDECSFDYIQIDNTKHCGSVSQPWTIISYTNIMNIEFKSDDGTTNSGYLAVWTPTTEPATYPISGCDNCVFPFTIGEASFETCIKIEDVDIQPWCSNNITPVPPAEEGTHLIPTSIKIPCTDIDSTCPDSPHQMLITSPEYPQQYPNNAEKVLN